MEKGIKYYFSVNGSDGNPNITEYDKHGSLRSLYRTQTSKTRNAKYL